MKKLLLIAVLLTGIFMLQAQTGSIIDKGPFIQLAYGRDTISIEKNQIVKLVADGNKLYITTTYKWNHLSDSQIATLTVADFGYANVSALRRHLETICFDAYNVTYAYDGSDNIDTIHYYYGSSLQYSEAFGYSGSLVTSKEIVTY